MELFSLQIDPTTKTHIQEVSRWSKILAICGFILSVLMIVFGLISGTLLGSSNSEAVSEGVTGFFALISAVTNIVFAVLLFFPSLFLLRFSKSINRSLSTNSQEHLNEGFGQLRNTFRFVGVVFLICIFFIIFTSAIMIMALIP